MLSLKQPVSTHEDSLVSITNHMLSHRSTCSSKINGCYVKRIEVSCQEFKKICSREGCSVTYDPYSYVRYLTVPGRSHEFVPSARKCDSNAVYLDASQVLKESSPRGSHSIIANRRDYYLRVCRVRHELETVLQLSHKQSFNGSI